MGGFVSLDEAEGVDQSSSARTRCDSQTSTLKPINRPAQVLFAQNGYRPVVRSAAKGFSFPYPPGVFSIQWLGGWAKVDKQFFDSRNGIVTKIQRRKGG